MPVLIAPIRLRFPRLWVDGAVHAFAFFGWVPQSVRCDNDRWLVAQILRDGVRRRTRLFEPGVGRITLSMTDTAARARAATKVRSGAWLDMPPSRGLPGEPLPGNGRNFMVPIPCFATWDALNVWLAAQCRKRRADVLRGHGDSIGQRRARD